MPVEFVGRCVSVHAHFHEPETIQRIGSAWEHPNCNTPGILHPRVRRQVGFRMESPDWRPRPRLGPVSRERDGPPSLFVGAALVERRLEEDDTAHDLRQLGVKCLRN